MSEIISVDVMFDNLCEEKQAEILEALGEGYEETNYDVFPVFQLVFSKDD
jgi:hypothetical protein